MRYGLKKSGFTVTELLVVTGIFALIIGASFTLLNTGRFSSSLTEARIHSQENAQTALQRLSRELRLSQALKLRISDDINFTAAETRPGSVVNFQVPLGSYDDQLNLSGTELQWGSADPSRADELDAYLAYSVDADEQLIRTAYRDEAGTDIISQDIIAQNISGLSFSRDTASSERINIQVDATEEDTSSGKTITQTLSFSVKLRN